MINTTMSNPTDEFFNSVDYPSIIDNIKGIYTSDGTMSTLLDFERVLDEADLYAFKNWELGEVVAGPDAGKYMVAVMLMYPAKLMPDPRGAKRLLKLGCNIKFKKTVVQVPVKIESSDDYKPGTHYPKLIDREVWLIRIEMPRELMNDIREGSIDLAGQTIDLDDLDSAYEDDLDKDDGDEETGQAEGQAAAPDMGMGGMPPADPNAMGAM
jgi:hypothetical protein